MGNSIGRSVNPGCGIAGLPIIIGNCKDAYKNCLNQEGQPITRLKHQRQTGKEEFQKIIANAKECLKANFGAPSDSSNNPPLDNQQHGDILPQKSRRSHMRKPNKGSIISRLYPNQEDPKELLGPSRRQSAPLFKPPGPQNYNYKGHPERPEDSFFQDRLREGPINKEGFRGDIKTHERFPGGSYSQDRFPGDPTGRENQRGQGNPIGQERFPGEPGGQERYEDPTGRESPGGPMNRERFPEDPMGHDRFPGEPGGPRRFGDPMGRESSRGPMAQIGPERSTNPTSYDRFPGTGQERLRADPTGQGRQDECPMDTDPRSFRGDPEGQIHFGGDPAGQINFGGDPAGQIRGDPASQINFGVDPAGQLRGNPAGQVDFGGNPTGQLRFGGDPTIEELFRSDPMTLRLPLDPMTLRLPSDPMTLRLPSDPMTLRLPSDPMTPRFRADPLRADPSVHRRPPTESMIPGRSRTDPTVQKPPVNLIPPEEFRGEPTIREPRTRTRSLCQDLPPSDSTDSIEESQGWFWLWILLLLLVLTLIIIYFISTLECYDSTDFNCISSCSKLTLKTQMLLALNNDNDCSSTPCLCDISY